VASRGAPVLIVIDTSVAMSWLFPDERDFGARLAQMRDMPGIAPAVLPFEMCNALQMAVRRGRLIIDDALGAIDLFYELGIEIEPPPGDAAAKRITALCNAHEITAYDAAYVELAMRRGAPLATYDERMRAAAAKAGVTILK